MLAGKSLATTTVHGLRAFLRGESLLCNFFSHNITSCSMTKPTSSNEFRTLSIEFWSLRYLSNKRDIIFSTSLSKRKKFSTRLRRGRRALVAEMTSALAAILDQRCLPLAEFEITAGAKLHFWAARGPSVVQRLEAAAKVLEWPSYGNSRKVTQKPHFLKSAKGGPRKIFQNPNSTLAQMALSCN